MYFYEVLPWLNLNKPVFLFSIGNNSLVNKSAIFDGLEEDEEELANIFVPRSSVKKLVLKPKIPPTIVSAGKKILHIL